MRTRVSAISPGSELLVYRGQAPRDVSVDENIAALGRSGFDYPISYGYAAVGEVTALGPGVSPDWLGRRVFAFHPHASAFVSEVAGLLPVPAGLAAEDAALLPNMETAVNFVLDGAPLIGERVLVLGQGVVGLLTTMLLAGMPLARLVVSDGIAARREWALRLGADAALAPDNAALRAALLDGQRDDSGYPGADLTYELSGNPAALQTAIACTGFAGRIVVGSWYGQKAVGLDLGGRYHRARQTLISSQVSTLSPALHARWTKARRVDVAWAMLAKLQPSRLISHRFSIDNAPAAYRLLDEHPENALQVIFTYEE